MAGDEDRKRVLRERVSDGAGALWASKILRDPAVGAYESARDFGLSEQDPLLKWRTAIEGDCVWAKGDVFTFEKSKNPFSD